MEDNINLENKKRTIKRKNLRYLGLNKFIGMYLIIRMHLYCNRTMPFDFGKRSCELLFISSGFLIGYNYYNNILELNYLSPFKYSYKHLRSFYPYYLLNLFYGIYLFKDYLKFDLTFIELLFINLLLLANWSSHKALARLYFQISWFLNNIFYCYFLSPFFIYSINNLKNPLKMFLFVSFVRIITEEFYNRGAFNIFDTHLHSGPIIRILEFYMGMLLSPLYFNIKARLDKFQNILSFKILITIIQILLPIILYQLMVKFDKILFRCYFVLILCIYVFIISFDYGYLSNIVEIKFVKIIMSSQMEMYLIQMNIHFTFEKHFGKLLNQKTYGLILYYIQLILICIIAISYRKLYRDKLSKFMDKIIFSLQ